MNRQRIQIIPLFIFLVIVSGTLLFLDKNRITDPARSTIEYYLLKLRGSSLKSDPASEELKSKIISLEKERDDLVEENRTLRKQLQSPLPPSYKFIPCIVLASQIDEQHAHLLVSGGSEEEIVPGMPVVTEQLIIGTVKEVTPHMNRVQLLSDPESSIAVKTNQRARGIVFGIAGEKQTQYALLDRVLQTEPLKVGDILETSGEDELPAGLLVGEVTELTTESRDPFQKAKVKLTIDPSLLDRVFIVKVE